MGLLVLLLWKGLSPRNPVSTEPRPTTSVRPMRQEGANPGRWSEEATAPIQLNRGAAGQDASARAGSFQGRIVSAASNQGIANAEITFQFARGVLSATSGREGAFHLEPSEVGTYRLASVVAEGFLPFAPEWGRSPITLQARPGEKIQDVVLYLLPAV
ncbi:MAG TPA: carboxypeptidase-like regulatory domain-containing protein, partial [Myxococcales bacterium]